MELMGSATSFVLGDFVRQRGLCGKGVKFFTVKLHTALNFEFCRWISSAGPLENSMIGGGIWRSSPEINGFLEADLPEIRDLWKAAYVIHV
jgi:hypothetical protein